MRRSTARTSWFAGFVIGILGGFVLLELPPLGLAIVAAAAVLSRKAGQAIAGASGLLVGLGLMWGATLGRVKLTCTNDVGCTAPSIDAYLTVAIVLLALGAAMSTIAFGRARRRLLSRGPG